MAKSNRRTVTYADYQMLFNTPLGEKVLWHILKQCSVLEPTMNLTHPDPLAMAFNEGKRSVALSILRALSMDLQKLDLLIKKQQEGELDEALLQINE